MRLWRVVHFDPLKKTGSPSAILPELFLHDLWHSTEQCKTKNGLLRKLSGFFIFYVDFHWTICIIVLKCIHYSSCLQNTCEYKQTKLSKINK